MKRIFLSILIIFMASLIINEADAQQPQTRRGGGFTQQGIQNRRGGTMQANTEPARPTGIEIVSKLEKPANARKLEEKDFAGYVMVYFKDQDQCAYMAISKDGYNFTDINAGQKVFDGTILAEQKGVRDPHITRGPDGAFYLAMTDLHIFGQRAGYRETAWQRPEEKYGWGNNRALVLMKSYDLIHWTHSDFRVDTAFPELGDIDCSWAPETVYDEDAGKMMVYFTIRYNNRNANMYCSYANDEFTKLETKPEMIPNIGGIDGDITKVGDKYHLYYVSSARILHAVSDKISTGYVSDPNKINPDRENTEAPNLFKRLGTDTWVLMYDIYGARPNNMGFSETKDFVNYEHIGRFNEGQMKGTNFERPKHGAVTYITLDELKVVKEHWNVDINLE
ncbi:MAG: glycoside hydrolase family 43 protein [Sedimentisphaerales bacterium]|nr:glycoside hydrolase family 43 protein [Sedimentisphaerales bacterium]